MKNHYYVSIPVYGHKVFKYVGEVPLGAEYNYTEAFKRYGLTGLPSVDEKYGPYDVLVFPSFRGDQIDDEGAKYPGEYIPKQIIMTKRIRGGSIARRVWTKKSYLGSEDAGCRFSQKYVWMLHYFGVDDEDAWNKAAERHRDIEEAQGKLANKLGGKLETVCPSQPKV